MQKQVSGQNLRALRAFIGGVSPLAGFPQAAHDHAAPWRRRASAQRRRALKYETHKNRSMKKAIVRSAGEGARRPASCRREQVARPPVAKLEGDSGAVLFLPPTVAVCFHQSSARVPQLGSFVRMPLLLLVGPTCLISLLILSTDSDQMAVIRGCGQPGGAYQHPSVGSAACSRHMAAPPGSHPRAIV